MTRSVTTGVQTGLVIADTYRITGLLGEGGMGAVWEAEHLRLRGKKVAIKFLHADVASDAESLARFKREADIAASLHHPNIANVHDYNNLEDGTPYFVLELLEGESLGDRIARGPIPEDEALGILREIAAALRAAHREGVVHRDLKPQNVFLCTTRDGGRGPVKVLDFGISKIRGSTTVKTQTQTVLGTPQYMSPEQATGKHDQVDARTDIFCLGIMAFEMLTGQPPWGGQNVPEVVFKIVYEPAPQLADLLPSLSPQVTAAIHTALAKNPDERFPSVDDMLSALGLELPTTPAATGPATKNTGPAAIAATVSSNPRGEALAATLDSGSASKSDLHPVPLTEPLSPDSSAAMTQVRAAATSEDHDTLAGGQSETRARRTGLVAGIALLVLVVAGGASALTVYMLSGDDEGSPTTAPAAASTASNAHRGDPREQERLEKQLAALSADTAEARRRADEIQAKLDALTDAGPVPGDGGAPLADGAAAKSGDAAKPGAGAERGGRPGPEASPQRGAPSRGSGGDEAAPRESPAARGTADTGGGGDQAPNSSGDGTGEPGSGNAERPEKAPSVAALLPSRARIARLPPAARQSLREGLTSIRRGNYMEAAHQAKVAYRAGGGDVALVVEVIARCSQQQQSVVPSLLRSMRNPRVRRRLVRFCEAKGVYVEL